MSLSKAFVEPAVPKQSFKQKQSALKYSGQNYMTNSGIPRPGRSPPTAEVVCGLSCRKQCRELDVEQKLKLFRTFYQLDHNEQGTFLMSQMELVPVRRRKYADREQFRRLTSVYYFLPDANGEQVAVCKKTFMNIFDITSSKRIELLIKRKKSGESVFKDKRGGDKTFKFTTADRLSVKQHIRSLPTELSHYKREQSSCQYLSQDLNMSRLYNAFKDKFPQSHVSYKFYAKVFKIDFPELKFRKARIDTCKTCDLLVNEKRNNNSPASKKADFELEKHHRKVENAFAALKRDTIASTLPTSDTCVIVIDLQKVFSLPKLTHSNMYYSRQLSCYNFGIHVCDRNTAVMCVWHEGQGSRGGNEMASCLFRAINNMNLTSKKKLIVWSDNCCGQIKNKMMTFLYIYLVETGIFEQVQHKFLVVGHSFSAADRDFALIEKKWKVSRAQTVEHVKEVIRSARQIKPFKVLDMEGKFLDFEKASAVINTSKLGISKASIIQVDKEKPGVVSIKKTFNDLEHWTNFKVWNKGVDSNTIINTNFIGNSLDIPLSDNKKKDLKTMLPYVKKENLPFFTHILSK